jgi:hypothetical protein
MAPRCAKSRIEARRVTQNSAANRVDDPSPQHHGARSRNIFSIATNAAISGVDPAGRDFYNPPTLMDGKASFFA